MFFKKFKAPCILHIRLLGIIGKQANRRVKEILRLNQKNNIDAVALSISSATGSVVEAQKIIKTLDEYSEQNVTPIYSFIEGYAIDVGYMVACCGQELSVNPFSVVGDLERSTQLYIFDDFLSKVGVRVFNHSSSVGNAEPFSGKSHDWVEMQREMMQDEKEIMMEYVNNRRSLGFLQNNVKSASKKKIESGGLFTANDALKNGLADKMETFLDFQQANFKDHIVLENTYQSGPYKSAHSLKNRSLFINQRSSGLVDFPSIQDLSLRIFQGAENGGDSWEDPVLAYNEFCERSVYSMITGD